MKIHKFGFGTGSVTGAEEERCRRIARNHRAVFMTSVSPDQFWFETHSDCASADERVHSAVMTEVGEVQTYARPPLCMENVTVKSPRPRAQRPTRILYTPPYCRPQQLHFCELLGKEFHRWRRYAPIAYDARLEKLRELYCAIRAMRVVEFTLSWTMEDVEQALGERRLGPRPMSTSQSCSCVPFPGAWSPDVRALDSHWHDRSVKMCTTCGEKRVRDIPKSMWPNSRALTIELYGSNPTKWPPEAPF